MRKFFIVIAVLCAALFLFIGRSLASGSTYTWTGGGADNKWSDTANWTPSGTPGVNDSVIFSAASSKASTWDAAASNQIASFTMNAGYGGTLTIAKATVIVGDWTFNAASSSLAAGTSTLQFQGSGRGVYSGPPATFVPGGASYYNFDDEEIGSVIYVSGTAQVANNFIIGDSAGDWAALATGTINVGGNVTVSSAHMADDLSINLGTVGWYSNNATIVLNGTSTQTVSSAGGYLPNLVASSTGTVNLVGPLVISGPNVTLNSSTVNVSGTIIVGNLPSLGNPSYPGSSWSANGGTVNAATATIEFDSGAPTTTFVSNASGTYGTFDYEGQGAAALLISGTMRLEKNLILGDQGTGGALFGGTIYVPGNVIVSSTNMGMAAPDDGYSGYTNVVLNGTSTQTVSTAGGYLAANLIASSTGTVNLIGPLTIGGGSVTINSGVVNLTGMIRLNSDYWCGPTGATCSNTSWVVNGGTVNTNTSTIRFYGQGLGSNFWGPCTSPMTFLPGATTYYNIDDEAINSLFYVSGTAQVANNLTLGDSGIYGALATGTVNVGGNVTVSASNDFGLYPQCGYANNATVVLNGTSTQIVNSPNDGFLPNVTVNKPSGAAITVSSAGISQALTVTNGEFRIGSSTTATTFEVDGPVTVGSGGIWSDFASTVSTIILTSSGVTNNGLVHFDGGVPCTPSFANILLRSYAYEYYGGEHTYPVPWSGTRPSAIMRDVDAMDQDNTVAQAIQVWNGLNSGYDTNWNFTNAPFITPMQNASFLSASASGVSVSFSYPPKQSDLIIAAVSAKSQSVLSVTDNQGNTYRLIASSSVGTANFGLFYSKNATSSGAFTVTASATGPANFLTLAAFDYSGAAPSTTLDTWASNIVSGGGAMALTSGLVTATTTDVNGLYFGAMTLTASTTAITENGWTPLITQSNNSTLQSLYVETTSSTSPMSAAATWTTATSTNYAAAVAIFRMPYSAAYAASGTLDSATFDTGVTGGAQLNSFLWQGVVPSAGNWGAGFPVGFQFAVSNAPTSSAWNFEGPDGTASTYFTGNAGTPINFISTSNSYAIFSGYRYFRYRVALFADPTLSYSPTVSQVTVNWSP